MKFIIIILGFILIALVSHFLNSNDLTSKEEVIRKFRLNAYYKEKTLNDTNYVGNLYDKMTLNDIISDSMRGEPTPFILTDSSFDYKIKGDTMMLIFLLPVTKINQWNYFNIEMDTLLFRHSKINLGVNWGEIYKKDSPVKSFLLYRSFENKNRFLFCLIFNLKYS